MGLLAQITEMGLGRCFTSMDEFTKGSSSKTPHTTKVSVKSGASATGNKAKIWAVVVVVLIVLGVIGGAMKNNNSEKPQQTDTTHEEVLANYVGQDAKTVYTNLTAQGYTVKFVFDRTNNGGFSDEQFQDFVINDSFASDSYSEMPFVVTNQAINDKNVILTIEYESSVEQNKARENREANLENKLSIITAMSSCEIYGKRNYRNFKLHSIVGRIAEYATDDDTWLLKYTADADGYKNLTMECYVTGTDSSPVVKDFKLY